MNSHRNISRRLSRTPETARFLRRAAPAFFREMAKEYSRESVPAPFKPKPKQWPKTGVHAAWLGHATVLLQIDGFTILTDPVFSSRVGLNFGPLTVGIKRIVEVAAGMEDLPQVDLVLLSHAHMDHFDLPSLRKLESKATHVVTAVNTSDLLRARRFARVHECRWDATVQAGAASVRAFEVAHWGARMRSDVYRGYNGYVLEVNGTRVLFGGDTAFTENFKSVRSSRAIDLAIMPIGAYDPWIRVHCNPEEAVRMADLAGADRILPIHHRTFKLSREEYDEPRERVLAAAGDRVVLTEIGQEWRR